MDRPGHFGGSDSWEDARSWRHSGSTRRSYASARSPSPEDCHGQYTAGTAVTRREPGLPGQTVAIIGGSAGIGLETARRARAEGAEVVLAARRADRQRQAAAEVGVGRTAAFDATDPAALERFFAGFVDTPLSASLVGDDLEGRRAQLRATLPIGRVVGPVDVAALAVHLMTNTAIAGGTYQIDGGQQLITGA